ncbi:unnamed protein product [Nesidiocoris tenuis]|uniref:Uncharacterized protein n=1 Tax=Nesidiocoris tenuis TaxID=355587 RepID=A0A6H5HJW1_9HEMI|nr:unnamed protein product [Nesidiocoris tenuis]
MCKFILIILSGASNTFSNRRQFDDRREGMRDFNRSSDDRRRRERSRSRGWRRSAERDQSLRQDKRYRDYEKPRRRRSDSAEINEHRRQYRKESKGSGSDDSRSRKYGRSSSDRRSGSLSSQDGRSKRTSRRSRSREYEKTKEDTFIKKFGGRRDLSSETHVIVDDVEYRDDTPSPDRSKPKKKKHEDKDKKKEKRRHDKKKKKKCSHKNSSDKESDALAVLDDSAAPRLDEVDDKEIYCPKLPPARREAPKILPTLPASSEESLPGNRSTDDVDKPKIVKMVSEAPEEFYGPKIPPKSKTTEGARGERRQRRAPSVQSRNRFADESIRRCAEAFDYQESPAA